MKAIADTLGVARSNLAEQAKHPLPTTPDANPMRRLKMSPSCPRSAS